MKISSPLAQSTIDNLYTAIQGRIHADEPEPLVLTSQPLPSGELMPDVVIESSGSSQGKPRLVGLSWSALRASAEATAAVLGEPGRWWLQLSPYKIAGFQVLVRSVLAGIPPSLTAQGCAFTSVVPTQLHKDLRSFAGLRAILVGGAPSPVLPGGLPLIRTYGMTETCGGCVYDGKPLAGVQVRCHEGRVLIAGPTLMDGYLGNAEQPFIDSDGTTWLITGDIGEFDGETLRILGRADDVIISGGVNVVPEITRTAILSAFPHLQVEVVGVPDGYWGEAVCAAVVGEVPATDIHATISGPQSPRVVVYLEEFPLLESGKVDKTALKRLVSERISAGTVWRR